MHDYHAVKALVARLERLPGPAILEVTVRASPIFSPEALQQAYEMLTAGTPLAGSRLAVEEFPERRECRRCGDAFAVSPDLTAGHLVICPRCGEVSALELGVGLDVVGITRARHSLEDVHLKMAEEDPEARR